MFFNLGFNIYIYYAYIFFFFKYCLLDLCVVWLPSFTIAYEIFIIKQRKEIENNYSSKLFY